MRILKILVIISCLLLSVVSLFAQNVLRTSNSVPLIHFDVVGMASTTDAELSRVSIFTEILYDDLQFLKDAENFSAEYEISATIWDGKEQVTGDIWSESVDVENYEQTNSRRHVDVSYHYFDIEPGKYSVSVMVEDRNGEKIFEGEKKIKVEDYSKNKLSLSDITFARTIDTDSLGALKSIFPEVTNEYKGLGSQAKAYFEIYNPKDEPQATLLYEITGEDFHYETTVTQPLAGKRNAMVFMLPVDSLSNGRYVFSVNAQAGRDKFLIEKDFYVRYSGLPRTAKDLESAILQLQYISTAEEWRVLRRAKGDDRLHEFEEFWKKQDPSADTEFNERMAVYYARVDAANQNFSVMGRDGWRTDRGMVFIILGPPDNIIRDDYPADSKPYQIWQYYSINRQFEFYDDSSFGDFKFVWPISVSELQRYAQMREN